MSYDIIYAKQFVSLRKTGEVIPLLLAGSNNCFDIGVGGRTGRRARDWSNIRYYNRRGKLSEKPEVILKNLDAELRRIIRDHRADKDVKPKDIRNDFGYYASLAVGGGHCCDTSWNLYRSQFANGIKNALTIEELDQLGVNLYFHTVNLGDSSDGEPKTVYLKTEREYFAELRKWREWQAQSGKSFWVSFNPHNDTMVLRRLRDNHNGKTPKVKTEVEQDHYFILTDGYNGLVRYTRRGFRYSLSNGGGKRFRTEKDAENYRQQLLKKGRYKADIWKVKRIDSNATFMV